MGRLPALGREGVDQIMGKRRRSKWRVAASGDSPTEAE
jgi:hypothetical protein